MREGKRIEKGSVALLLLLGLVGTASAEGARRVTLERPAPRAGDAFAVEQRMTFVMGSVGGPEWTTLDAKSGFRVAVLAQHADGYDARFDIAEGTTVATLDGERETETTLAKTITARVRAEQLAIGPSDESRGIRKPEAQDLAVLGDREAVTVGETWRAERLLMVATDLFVPMKTVYRVVGLLPDGKGHEVLKLELESQGAVSVPDTPVRVVVSGRGTALVDPRRADRPLEVRIGYRIQSTGGDGPDAESRSEMLLRTRELPRVESRSSVAVTGSASPTR